MVAIWPESRLALASSRTSELGREGLLSPLTEWRDCRAEERRRFSFSDISDRGRLAPPVTPYNQKPKSPEPESPIITPASTGDYMIVTTPSSLPFRSRPPPLPDRQTKGTVDLDDSPPKNLVPPEKPDQALSTSSEKAARRPPPPVVAKPKNLRSTSVSCSVTGLD